MRYCGSKRRFMRYLKPILQQHLDSGECDTFVDAFCGGGNVICQINAKNKVAIEYNSFVYHLWTYLQMMNDMGRLPMSLTEEEYYDVKNDYVNKGGKYPNWLIGYVGTALSWGGGWFNGYPHYNPKKEEDHIKEAYNGLEKQIKSFISLRETKFNNCSYDEYDYPDKCVIYCDPPYQDTKKYESDFDHDKFWNWVRKMSKKGHYVYVSEYSAPSDFECIWSMDKADGMGTVKKGQNAKRKTEKLFIYHQ